MRIAFGMLLLGALAVALTGPLAGQPAGKPSKDDIARWIKLMGSDEFTEREEATRKLWEAGSLAEEAINKAARSEDAEISRRATDIAEKFRWGIYPDTPRAVAAAIGRFQTGDQAVKTEVIKELLETGTPGCKALVRIARQELGAEIRPQLLAVLNTELSRSIPDLIATKNHGLLVELLDIAMDDPSNNNAQQNYVAYWLLAEKLDERIAHHKKLLDGGNTERRRADLMAMLYRAKGAYKEAVALADKAGNEELATSMLHEAGDWKELSTRGAKIRQGDEVESLGYRTAYARLAGDTRAFDALVLELVTRGEMQKPENDHRFEIAKALFLNGKADEGMALLEKGPYHLDRVQILIGRMRFKEAFELIKKIREEKLADLPKTDLLEARTLYTLGERDRARKIFDSYGEKIKPENDLSWLEDLVEAEAKSNLRDRAIEHTGKIFAASTDQGWPARLLPKVFPGRGDVAEPFWQYLRLRFKGQDNGVLLRQMRDILDGKVKGEALLAIAKNANDTLGNLPQEQRPVPLVALASVLHQAGEDAAALALLEPLKLDKAHRLQGDIHFARSRFAESATAYRAAFDLNKANPVLLYLSGLALEKAGKVEEGKAVIEQSHWICLGREGARLEFIKELAKRGHAKGLAREVALLRKTAMPGEYEVGEALRRDAIAAMDRRDYAASADAHEQAMLRCLRGYIQFVEKAAYIGVPAMVLSQRAAGLVQAGKFAEAQQEYDRSMALTPGAIEGTIRMVEVLDKAGRKKEADVLFEKMLGQYRVMLKEYPDCAWALNSTAWLAATCKRGLDQAKKDAERATTLDPEAAGYHDTLAEVLFQLGDKEKAIEAQKKAVALAPQRMYFKKQLARIEAGDKTAKLPLEEDDEEED